MQAWPFSRNCAECRVKLIYWLFSYTTAIPMSPFLEIWGSLSQHPLLTGIFLLQCFFFLQFWFIHLWTWGNDSKEICHWKTPNTCQASVVCFCESAIWTPQKNRLWLTLIPVGMHTGAVSFSFFPPFYYPFAPRPSQPPPHHSAGPTPLPQYSRDYWQPTKLDWKRGEQVQTRW